MKIVKQTLASEPAAFRSGVAARMAGVAVETLRVWERRYQLFAPSRSASGQRLYSAEQVRRLALLKQLVDQGHPIGALADLPEARLVELSGALTANTGAITIAIVGTGVLHRFGADALADSGLLLARSCAQLGQTELLDGADADLLIVDLAELTIDMQAAIMAARDAANAAAVLVLYRFAATSTLAALRIQGCMTARAPAELGDLAALCNAARTARRAPLAPSPRSEPAAPRFDADALARLGAARTNVTCECPRHLADILLMVGSFERYTAACASRDIADAALHDALRQAAGHARVLLEVALERLAREDGLPLPAR